jgi:hypothetical protein
MKLLYIILAKHAAARARKTFEIEDEYDLIDDIPS